MESGLPNSSQNETGDELNVSSLVMSCYLALGGVPVFNLSSPVLLYFKPRPPKAVEGSAHFGIQTEVPGGRMGSKN